MEVLAGRRAEWRRRVEAARRFAYKLRERLAPATAVVIGSTARGDFNVWSDIDVVVVSDKLPDNPLRRFDMLLDALEPGVEPIPLRRRDALRLAEKGAPMVEEIVSGIPIYDDLGLLEELRRILGRRKAKAKSQS